MELCITESHIYWIMTILVFSFVTICMSITCQGKYLWVVPKNRIFGQGESPRRFPVGPYWRPNMIKMNKAKIRSILNHAQETYQQIGRSLEVHL